VKRLYLRELRRLSMVGVGSVFLGAMVFFLLLAFSNSGLREAPAISFGVVYLVAPWLLGASFLAPDAESGATRFLVTLPLSAWHQLGARVGALLTWWVGLMLGGSAFQLALSGHGPDAGGLLTGLAILGAASLASVATRRSLAAFAFMPVFPAAVWALYLGIVALVTWSPTPEWLLEGTAWALPVLLAVTAVVVFVRGELHTPSRRPLKVTAAVLGGAVVLAGGVTSAAYAYTRLYPEWRLVRTHRLGQELYLTYDAPSDWTRGRHQTRSERILADGSGTRATALPEGAEPVASSPGGLILAYADDEGLLLDQDLAVMARPSQGRPGHLNQPGTFHTDESTPLVLWHQEQPYWVLPGRLVTMEGAEIPFPAGMGPAARSLGGERMVLLKASSDNRSGPWRFLWSPFSNEEPHALALPDGVQIRDTMLSPCGRYLLLASWDASNHVEVWWLDLDGSREPQLLPLTAAALDVGAVTVQFSPDRQSALIQAWIDAPTEGAEVVFYDWLVDLQTGDTLEVTEQVPVAFSPSGSRILYATGWADRSDPLTIHEVSVPKGCSPLQRAFVDERHALYTLHRTHDQLLLVDLEGDARTRVDLEPSTR
jgi:hypothetical protein